jgi:hypothetical protein
MQKASVMSGIAMAAPTYESVNTMRVVMLGFAAERKAHVRPR